MNGCRTKTARCTICNIRYQYIQWSVYNIIPINTVKIFNKYIFKQEFAQIDC